MGRFETDAQLIAACLRGEPRAWDALVERYRRLVYSIPRRLGLSETDADDVFQIVWGIVLRRLETLKDVERLAGWLSQTTYRESWRLGKRRRQQATAELDDRQPDDESPSDDDILKWERQHLVHTALGRLDDPCRRLLEALFLSPDDPDYQTIADRLGMKIGSIGPTRARCFKKLEGLLRQLGF